MAWSKASAVRAPLPLRDWLHSIQDRFTLPPETIGVRRTVVGKREPRSGSSSQLNAVARASRSFGRTLAQGVNFKPSHTIKKPQVATAHSRRGVFDMFRSILKLTLCLCLGALATPAALAQAPAPITEQQAHAIGVDAYVYFYSLVTMDISRKQFTNMPRNYNSR